MSTFLIELGNTINSEIGTDIEAWTVEYDELSLQVDPIAILRVLSYLKAGEQFQFSQLMDICGVDYLGRRTPRFDVVYHLLSIKHNCRIRVKAQVEEGEQIPSVTSIFSSAGWWERETFDLYGIPFADHPDLRRILTDYGFEGHPMRKDFPLTGYVELRYDEEEKRVAYEPVQLAQAYRNFDTESPWEAMKDVAAGSVLPGDEKALEDGRHE